jgi:hypothetical protein
VTKLYKEVEKIRNVERRKAVRNENRNAKKDDEKEVDKEDKRINRINEKEHGVKVLDKKRK